jgi:hypothetical protein
MPTFKMRDVSLSPGPSLFLTTCQANATPILFSVRQITRHRRLERPKSKESAKTFGMPTEDAKCMLAPKFVRLRTVQSKRDERLSKMILAPFNTRAR